MPTKLFAGDQTGYNLIALLDTSVKEVRIRYHKILLYIISTDEVKASRKLNINLNIHTFTELALTQSEVGFFFFCQMAERGHK